MRSTLATLLLLLAIHGYSQQTTTTTEPPFEKEILAFEAQDRQTPPPANAILFVGSSSIRFWDSLQVAFPDKPIIRRGFGGSQINDVTRYINRIIIPYRPKQIVFYAGTNDIAVGGQTAAQVYNRFLTFYTVVRRMLPGTQFTFISIGPAPSRRNDMTIIVEANKMIKNYLAGQRNAAYIDIYSAMLDENGQPRTALFKGDSLHLNEYGYAVWADKLRTALK